MLTIHTTDTNQTVTLSVYNSNGIDWVADMISNAGMLGHPIDNGGFEAHPSGDGTYVATQDTIDWWREYIDGYERTQANLDTLQDDLDALGLDGYAIIQKEFFAVYPNIDMDQEYAVSADLMHDIRSTYLTDFNPGDRP